MYYHNVLSRGQFSPPGYTQLFKADHAALVLVPYFQAQAGKNIPGMQGSCFGGLQFREMRHDLGQAVERYFGIEVVNVVVTNVGGKPGHHRVHDHIAGGFERCFIIRPVLVAAESNAREIVLRIKEVRAQCKGDQERQEE